MCHILGNVLDCYDVCCQEYEERGFLGGDRKVNIISGEIALERNVNEPYKKNQLRSILNNIIQLKNRCVRLIFQNITLLQCTYITHFFYLL